MAMPDIRIVVAAVGVTSLLVDSVERPSARAPEGMPDRGRILPVQA